MSGAKPITRRGTLVMGFAALNPSYDVVMVAAIAGGLRKVCNTTQ